MGSKILLAEDQAIVAMELEHRLRALGYTVCGVVSTADGAIARASLMRPDALLFDIRLRGDRDGIEAARAIQAERMVPVVFLSAYSDEVTLERVRSLDHSSYLLKPFDERMLQITIEAALHEHRVTVERNREERARRRTEARLAAILDHSPDAIVSLGEDRRITVFSHGAERVFGYAASEMLGKHLDVLLDPSGLELEDLWAGLATETAERVSSVRRELGGRRKDGQPFFAEVAFFRTDAEGERLYSLILRDVSERKRLEARTLQAQKLEAVGRLAAGVAHDFNNLLAAIHCNAYLASLQCTLEAQGPIDEILADVERGAALTRQVLTVARREPAEREPTDVSLAVAAIEPLVRTLVGRAIQARFELEVGAGVAEVTRTGLEQIVVNLVVNARDAMPEGGVVGVRTRARTIEAPLLGALGPIAPGRYVELEVSDTGTGMTPDVAARIFEAFFTTKPLGHGTGLGLMTVSDVLNANDGALELTTEPGSGSTFRALLPALDGVAPVRTTARPPQPLESGRALRVLVVDDDDALRMAASRILTHTGFLVCEARSPDEAQRVAAREVVDVVVCDVQLPALPGPELVSSLRSEHPDMGVVLMSGHGCAELSSKDRHELLQKPFLAGELVDRVRDAALPRTSRAGAA